MPIGDGGHLKHRGGRKGSARRHSRGRKGTVQGSRGKGHLKPLPKLQADATSMEAACFQTCGNDMNNMCGGGCEDGNMIWCICCDSNAPYPGTNSGYDCDDLACLDYHDGCWPDGTPCCSGLECRPNMNPIGTYSCIDPSINCCTQTEVNPDDWCGGDMVCLDNCMCGFEF